jgi:hypothetical protein
MRTLIQRADERLAQWGNWARKGEWLGLPSSTMLARYIEQGAGAHQAGRPPVSIPEDVAEVDAAVCKLVPFLKIVCREHYTTTGEQIAKAKRLGLSKRLYRMRLENSQRQVASWISI